VLIENTITPIAFLAIPKCDRRYDDSAAFRKFKRQLYHASIAAVLQPLHSGLTGPVVRRCPDGHFRRVIYDLIAFIADYPEQVMLAGIVQGWCPKCTAHPDNLDVNVMRRTPTLTDGLVQVFDCKKLWKEYGIDNNVIPFTANFPRGDIYEMISPDLLHQLIKGTFKDHLVTWICEYLVIQYGERQAGIILDDIDQRIAAVPPFPGLRRFPHGRRFKQWTGDDSKALMKVYLPAIVPYVPEDIVKCLSALLDATYIVRRQDIGQDDLDSLNTTLDKFWWLREVFRTHGVRPDGFSLPRQHALFHLRRQIEDFGAPGGLCSSITESRHITAVKKPWRRSNRHEALGQMLVINQRLDKLAAMHTDFVARGMLPAGHPPWRNLSTDPTLKLVTPDNNDDDDGAPVEENVMGHVVLAHTHARSYPQDMNDLSIYVKEPNLYYMTQECIATQLRVSSDDLNPIGKVSVFASAMATFFAPSDPSGIHGMRRERIRSTPSWRGREPRYDCAFVVEDQEKLGMSGIAVVRVRLLFSVEYDGVHYPCALVEWFKKMGCDPLTGLWIVHPDCTRGSRDKSVLHLDSFLHGAHLIPVYNNLRLPPDFKHFYSLDVFNAYYVNKYIDYHTYEIAY